MMPHLIGLDPSTMLYRGLSAALPEVAFGWDMPEGDGPKCLMVLDPGRYPTPGHPIHDSPPDRRRPPC